MSTPKFDLDRYRPCVGIAIFNAAGQVWYGKRKGEKGPYRWQFPQGGIDAGESAKAAARRELYEETGLTSDHYDIVGRIDDWLCYEFPPEYAHKPKARKRVGQKQKWFAVRLKADDTVFDLKAHPPQEFSEWRWGDLSEGPGLIVPFKRGVYERLVTEFRSLTHIDRPKACS